MGCDSATPQTVVRQPPLSMEFSRQEYWSGLFPPPGDLSDPGIEPRSLISPALAGRFFTTAPPGKPQVTPILCQQAILFPTSKRAVRTSKDSTELEARSSGVKFRFLSQLSE